MIPSSFRSMGNSWSATRRWKSHYRLINGDQIFPPMLESIRQAKKSINLETYIYCRGKFGQQFAERLAERANAGVHVHVLLDWLGSRRLDSKASI